MTTKRKLHAERQRVRQERAALEAEVHEDPTERPRWKRHSRGMEAMLRGVDPLRFERLADGY